MAGEEPDRPAQKAGRARRPLVGEDLDVGKAGGVVDADVDEFPADRALDARASVRRRVVPRPVEALAGAALDPAELLDVDVDSSPGRERS